MIAAVIVICLAGQPCKPPVQARISPKLCGHSMIEYADPRIGTTQTASVEARCAKAGR